MARVNIDKLYDEVKSGSREKGSEEVRPLLEGSKLMVSTDQKPRLIKKDPRRQ